MCRGSVMHHAVGPPPPCCAQERERVWTMTVRVRSQADRAADVTRREEIEGGEAIEEMEGVEKIEEMIERLEGWRIRVATSHADATALLKRLLPNESSAGLSASAFAFRERRGTGGTRSRRRSWWNA